MSEQTTNLQIQDHEYAEAIARALHDENEQSERNRLDYSMYFND